MNAQVARGSFSDDGGEAGRARAPERSEAGFFSVERRLLPLLPRMRLACRGQGARLPQGLMPGHMPRWEAAKARTLRGRFRPGATVWRRHGIRPPFAALPKRGRPTMRLSVASLFSFSLQAKRPKSSDLEQSYLSDVGTSPARGRRSEMEGAKGEKGNSSACPSTELREDDFLSDRAAPHLASSSAAEPKKSGGSNGAGADGDWGDVRVAEP